MKICVVGAGAMGGLMGTKLLLAGEEVMFIDREGPHLQQVVIVGDQRRVAGESARARFVENQGEGGVFGSNDPELGEFLRRRSERTREGRLEGQGLCGCHE